MARRQKTTSPRLSTSRIERWYGKIVTGFMVLTALLVVLIIYFSFSTTTITVTPAIVTQEVQIETTLQDVEGVLLIADIEETVTYDKIEGSEQDAKSTGTVTIFNTYSQSQPLVETTRLLSDEGVLFRTTETVTVPAGGQVEVGIVADEPGSKGMIDASHFTIVALWEGLQDKIYAESVAPTSKGTITVGVVSQTTVANAKKESEAMLQGKALQLIADDFGSRQEGLPANPILLTVVEPAVLLAEHGEPSVAVGEEANAFDITSTMTVGAPVVNSQKVAEIIQTRFGEEVADGFTAVSSDISFDDMTIAISNVSEDKLNADITITVPLRSTISQTNKIVSPAELTHRTESEVQAYFDQFEEVESVSIQLSPFWAQRTPDVVGNISIKLAQ